MHEELTHKPSGRGFAGDAYVCSREALPRAAESTIRELDHRHSDRIDVRLLWDPQPNRVFVAVEDERDGATVAFEAGAAHALDGFRHPYACASHACDYRGAVPFESRPSAREDRKWR